jgi:hypothetical protein
VLRSPFERDVTDEDGVGTSGADGEDASADETDSEDSGGGEGEEASEDIERRGPG